MRILAQLCDFAKSVKTFFLHRPQISGQEEDRILDLVEGARLDWHEAKALFEQTNDPRLVEYAAYELKAKERRYVYLVESARKRNVRIFEGGKLC